MKVKNTLLPMSGRSVSTQAHSSVSWRLADEQLCSFQNIAMAADTGHVPSCRRYGFEGVVLAVPWHSIHAQSRLQS
jgi:hypothetical protein